MTNKNVFREDRRLRLLCLMRDDPAYQVNLFVAQDALKAMYAHPISMDALISECEWLAELGLLEISDLSGIKVIKLTQRGLDVAQGNTFVSGVRRPRPE